MSSGNNISYQHVNTRRRIDLLTNNPAFSVSSSRIDRKSERFQGKHRCLSKYLRFKARLTWRLSLKSDNSFFLKYESKLLSLEKKSHRKVLKTVFVLRRIQIEPCGVCHGACELAESAEHSGACALV